MKITKDVISHAYELLRHCEPFDKWNLPEPEDVQFKVAKSKSCYGWHNTRSQKKHTIAISKNLLSSIPFLIEIVAHEMIHMHMSHSHITDTSDHGPAFKAFAAQVCKIHHFDPKAF